MKSAWLVIAAIGLTIPKAVMAECTTTRHTLLAEYCRQNEFSAYGCSATVLVDSLTQGLARLQISSLSFKIAVNATLSDQPVTTIKDIVDHRDYKNMVIVSHGNTQGVTVEYYLTEAARNAAFDAYPQQWRDNNWVRALDGDPGPRIFFDGTGAQGLVKPYEDQNFLLGAFWCESAWTRSYWGIPPDGTTGRTMYGYVEDVPITDACWDVQNIIRGLGCYKVPLVLGRVDDSMIGVRSLQLYGNRTNYLNCSVDCDNWAASFIAADAFDSRFNWATIGEDPESRYLVYGFREKGGPPELLATVPGRGSDGHSVIRTYSIPVPAEFGYGQISEIDANGVQTNSRSFSWGQKPYRWNVIESMENHVVDANENTLHATTPPIEWAPAGVSGDISTSQAYDEECADVVICSSLSYLMSPQYFQASEENTLEGYPIKVRAFLTGADSASIKTALQSVVDANESYNHDYPTGRQYPTDPVLIVVGTPSIINYCHFPNEWQTCQTPQCVSYGLLGDLDNDGIGECPVTVVNSDSLFESERSAEYASDFNHNRFVDSPPHALLCVGDGYRAGHGNPALLAEMQQVMYAYLTSGNLVRALKLESDYNEDYLQMIADGRELINEGVRDIWVQSLTSSVDDLTAFVGFGGQFHPADLATKQRIVVWAPSCETLANWYGEMKVQVDTGLLFNDPEHTCASAFIGQLNGGYGAAHRASREVLLNELSNVHGQRVPYATIVRNAARTLNDQFPGAGKGLTCFGSYVLCPSDVSTSAVPDGPSTQDHNRPRIWASRQSSISTAISLDLPRDIQVDVSVFDIQGRKIATIKHEKLASGRYTYSWFHEDSPSGVYFARLNARDSSGASQSSVKIVLTK